MKASNKSNSKGSKLFCANFNILQEKKIRRPNWRDLQLDATVDMDDDDNDGVDDEEAAELMCEQVSLEEQKRLRLGVYFVIDELLKRLPEENRLVATKKSRLEKWFEMVSYGLDPDVKYKVFKHTSKTSQKNPCNEYGIGPNYSGKISEIKPFEFTNYARIGLENYFVSKPEEFLRRLAKGPPP